MEWQGWEPESWTTLRLHLPLKDVACRVCGSLDPGRRNVGVVHAPAPDGVTLLYPTRRLHATRCVCGHDQVYDLETDECWDLDDTDYGDEGSVDPNTVQGALF